MKLLNAISKIASLTVVALLIAASVFAAYSYFANNGQTRTVTVTAKLTTITTTTAVTRAATTQSTNVASSSDNSSELYELAFNQTDPCSNFGTIIPWSVVLTTSEGSMYNITEPNSTPLSECCWTTGSSANSSIVFSVPDGTYFYGVYGNPHTYGNVTVAGDDVTVFVQDEVASCGSSTFSILTNSVTESFENFSFSIPIWSNNTNVQDSISDIMILTNNTVSCQVVQFDVSPASYVFIRPVVIVNSNGSFFGLTYANGTPISYLSNTSQDYYYTERLVEQLT